MAATAEDLIPEDLAQDVVGVSGNTLLRFAEAGYLKTQASTDGQRQYFKSELSQVFGIKNFKNLNFQTTVAENLVTFPQPDQEAITATPSNDDFPEFEEICEPEFDSESSDHKNPAETSNATSTSVAPQVDLHSTPEEPKSSMHWQIHPAQENITKLSAIIELQEKLLESREAEIRDLKDQRNWLQQRVEKMEDKATRDQLLLLTETQILSKMVAMREERKNPLRLALGWISGRYK